MMATPGSDSAIFRAADSTPVSAISIASPIQPASRNSNLLGQRELIQMPSTVNNDDDDASDVSMSAETDDSDEDSQGRMTSRIIFQQHTEEHSLPGQVPVDTSRKRKLSFGQSNNLDAQSWGTNQAQGHKRAKLDLGIDSALASYWTKDGHLPVDRSRLPAEIWHHIFTFTSPRALGRLLQVNKIFRAYLDPSSSDNPQVLPSLSRSVTLFREPEAIWQASRRLFRPGMPSPLQGLSDLDMWKLAGNTSCQFCDRKDQSPSPIQEDQWHSGPGQTRVSPIWPFAIRSCGPCLSQRSIKDIDLFLTSSVPSPLMTALPFIFLTNDLHVAYSTTLQQGQPPAHIQLVKYFLNIQVEDIKQEFFKVKAMGSGTAEEWLKGLDDRGREKRNDASRWERWEATGGVKRMGEDEPTEVQEIVRKSRSTPVANAVTQLDTLRLAPPNLLPRTQGAQNQPNNFSSQQAQVKISSFSAATPPRFDSPAQTGFNPFLPRPYQQQRQERTKEEVAELKAARRAEIERRCMLLDPPLQASVLSHMGSFQAAIQIIKPLDDTAWEVLKPRLLSQFEEAQQRENERIAQSRVIQEKFDERRQQDVFFKEAKDVVDREWEDAQMPLRNRIGSYADEIIRDGWNDGEKVTKENSPRFAAEVLIYVRKRFYAEIAKDDAAARAAGQELEVDPPNGPFTQKLTLENMKWVFDMKIKPHTEQYSKELFLCNGCENNFKFYGFEGVIQHYAAKHTSALSVGSIVVHWRAEWPEYPPFNPDPSAAKTMFYATSKSSASYANGAGNLPQSYGFGGYPPVSGPSSTPVPTHQLPAVYQQSPGPFYGQPHFSEQFTRPQAGQFIQPQAFQGPQGPSGPPYQGPQTSGYPPYAGQGYPPQSFDGSYPNPTAMTFDSPQIYPVSIAEQPGQAYHQMPPFQPIGQQNLGTRPIVPFRTEAYKAQLQDVAQSAREVWNYTTGVKDMPGSVRVFVILHHILKKFRAKYQDDPTLAMLIDGLSNNKDMRPVRNVNGLTCRACNLEKGFGHGNPKNATSKGIEKKYFSLPQLFKHFHSLHSAEDQSPIFDWTTDMVELPDKAKISALARAPGMDDHKMQLIVDALPDAFSVSPPPADQGNPEPYPVYRDEPLDDDYGHLLPPRDNHEKYYTSSSSNRPPRADNHYDNHHSREGEMAQEEPILVTTSGRRYTEDRHADYQEQVPMTYIERRIASPSTQVRTVGEFGRHVRDDAHVFPEPVSQYRETDGEYRRGRTRVPDSMRDGSHIVTRVERNPVRDVSLPRLLQAADRAAQGNTAPIVQEVHNIHNGRDQVSRGGSSRPPRRSQQPSRADPLEAGSEDGELRAQQTPKSDAKNMPPLAEAESAAERFLNEFNPSENADEYAKKAEEIERRNEDALRARWESERVESMRRMYQPSAELPQRIREGPNDDLIVLRPSSPKRSPASVNGRPPHDRSAVQQHHVIAYDYDDRYTAPTGHPQARLRSSEPVDHRCRVNDAVYRDDRHVGHGNSSHSGRYARYENVRIENDRARSRSPVYVKLGALPGQYREQSPPRYPQQEPIYPARTAQAPIEEITYERVPRQEYYRVYTDEPRQRQPVYEGQVEYVQVADSQGDYVIRRPVRREPEPVYAAYENAPFTRQAVYETRAPVSRSDPAYYEEYDPRHPAPPPSTTIRQVRYP